MDKQIIEEIEARRAFRDFEKKPANLEAIDRILSAAHLAPSCFNHQPWRFLVLHEEESLQKGFCMLSKGNAWAKESSFLVAVLTRDDFDCKLSDNRDYALFDTGLAVQNMILQAWREGMVGHPMAGFDPVTFKELFSIPSDYRLITLVSFGFLKAGFWGGGISPRERKPLEDVVSFNKWKEI